MSFLLFCQIRSIFSGLSEMIFMSLFIVASVGQISGVL